MKVPIVQLSLPDEVLKEVKEVLKSGMWVEGTHVRDLEKRFSDYCGVKYCRAVNSGTSALLSIIASLDIEPGSEVIIPSFTFIATANCLKIFGLQPVFADIDPRTFNISPKSILEKISNKTKAIMPVDLFGLCANYDVINKIANENDLILIEDSCQAHGAELKNKKAGSFGVCGAFSLYPTKNMYCGGEGGLVVTDNTDIYNRVNRFVNHGQSKKYVHEELGLNFRMPAISGVCGKYSLSVLDKNNRKRIKNAELYDDLFENVEGIITPTKSEDYKHVYHQYTIRVENRDEIVEQLIKNNIGFGIHYKIPIHQQPYYKRLGYGDSLPETEKAAAQVLSLPIHPLLSEEQIQFVARIIKKII
ncbi:MAG: aminotransferase DegT [Candidatus Lokiarchaeota archaeon]|nr:aminotransferase DegT [Candidatus Lokiarchaeota archaeon]